MSELLWKQEPVRRMVPGSHRRRAFVIAAVAMAFFGIAVGITTWMQSAPAPYFVPLWVTQYKSPAVPPSPSEEADREAIRYAQIFPRGSDGYSSQEAALLLREIQAIDALPARESVVVYLSAYAVSVPGGGVDLLPADTDPSLGANTIALTEILRKLVAAPPRRKLLVLDLRDPTRALRIGDVRADVPAKLAKLIADTVPAGSNLWVLTSCGPGQISQRMPAEGRTAFGYYFEQGLTGAARLYHAPDHPNDRHISVRELTRFLQTHVDRWARDNRGVRQTPQLYGEASDFDLVACGPNLPAPPVPTVVPPLPPWLATGWSEVEQWRNDGTLSESPRLFVRLLASVRRANIGWRGPSQDRIQQELAFSREQVAAELLAARKSVPAPIQPATLAVALTNGAQPDPELRKAADQLLADIHAISPGPAAEVNAATTKLLAAFAKLIAGKPRFATEFAMFRAIFESSEARPDVLKAVGQLLTANGAVPEFAEARFLVRLGELAARVPVDRWPADLVRLAVRAVQHSESVIARADLVPWVLPVMDACAQSLAEGQILFTFWGDVPDEEIAARFRRADSLAMALTEWGNAFRTARSVADHSLSTLPFTLVLVERLPDREPLWSDLARTTLDILPLLTPPTTPLTEAELLPRGDDLRRRTERIRQAALTMAGGAPSDVAGWLTARIARADAGPDVVNRIDATLTLPGVPLVQRNALHAAGSELSSRLSAATRIKDADEWTNGIVLPPTPLTAPESEAGRLQELRIGNRRAQWELELLQIAGLPQENLDSLNALVTRGNREGPNSSAWDEFSEKIRDIVTEDLREIATEASLSRVDLLSFLIPGDEPVSRLDTPPGGPRFAQRQRVVPQHLAWLGTRYRYFARNGYDAVFYGNAIANLGLTTTSATLPGLEFSGTPDTVPLPADATTATARLTLIRPTTVTALPTARVLLPDDSWLRTTVTIGDAKPNPALPSLRFSDVTLRIESTGFRPPMGSAPTGVIVECRAGAQSVFARVPLGYGNEAPPIDVIVSRDAKMPVDVGDRVRLRPSETPQAFVTLIRNRSAEARPVIVRASGPFPQVETKLVVPGNGTAPVVFPPPAPMPPGSPMTKPVPDATLTPTSLRVELLSDNKTPTVLRDRTIVFDLADPLEYVEIVSAVFDPVNPPDRIANRLAFTLRARHELGAIPCIVELVLDPKQIPGLRGIRSARLKGQLPSGGQAITLEASGLMLDPEASETGSCSLNVDGVAQSLRFRVTFARFGDSTSPILDVSPQLRLQLLPNDVPGQSVKFQISADSTPLGSKVDVRMLRTDPGFPPVVEREETFSPPRRRSANIALSPTGFTIAPTIQDWSSEWKLPLLIGPRTLEARLLTTEGTVLRTERRSLVLDTSPPNEVAFVGLPPQSKRGAPIPLKAEARDSESNIASVKFFFGKPMNGAVPPTAKLIPAAPVPGSPGVWQASLTPTADQRGSLDIGVIAENAAGLTTTSSGSVELVDELPVKPGAITGTVLEGNRPQVGLMVTLADAKGGNAKTARTGNDGSFQFEKLAPGKYTLTVRKSSTNRSAKQEVTVTAGTTVTVILSLLL